MEDAGPRDLPFLNTTAWAITGILAASGPLIQWLAPPETGLHPYLWAALFLTPALAVAAAIGPRDARWAYAVVLTGAVASSIAVALVSPEPVGGGLLRPVAALPLWVAAAIVPFPRIIIAFGIGSMGLTAWVGREAETGAFASTMVAHFAAAALAVGIAYGWQQGRLAAVTVGRLSAEMEHRRIQDEALRVFLHRAAHELRTPLTPLMMLPTIIEKTTDPQQREAYMEKMKDRLQHVVSILDRMGTLAAMGKASGPGKADLSLEAGRLATDPRVESVLPPSAPVRIHPEALELAIRELVRNAETAAQNWIRLLVEDTGDAWALHVDDDGPGIPEADRAALMEPFGRVDRDLPPQAGTGLGLPIARTIALSADGDLDLAESELGGLRVSLSLPKV